MKKVLFGLLTSLALVGTSMAGTSTVSKEYKEYKGGPEYCFNAGEFQLDLFGTYQAAESGNYVQDGFGGGVGVNYFFSRYIGIGAEGNWNEQSAEGNVIHNVNGSLIVRFPIDSVCLAPYIYGGGGGGFDSINQGLGHAGAGLEYRATPNFGIFGDGRYTWTEKTNDYGLFRLGARFVF